MKTAISAICRVQHLDYALRERAVTRGDGEWGREGRREYRA